MKRIPALGAVSSTSAQAAPGVLIILAVLATLALLGGCVGAPEVSEGGALSPEAVAEAFDGARGLLVAATPKALEEAAVRMSQAGLPQPEAEQLAALAGSVYRLLYAERGVPPEFPPPGVYSGPYQPALADAALGRPPRAGWSPPAGAAAEGVGEAGAAKDQAARQGPAGGRSARAAARRAARKGAESAERQPETTGAEGRLTELLNRVIPALYLARVDSPDSVPGSGLEGGLEEGLELAREANPGSVVPPYLLGRAAELAGRREQAEELFRGCLALSDSFYPARRRLAALYLAEGRGAQAAQQLEELHAEFPRDGVLRDSLIQARLLAGEPEQVSALVAEALVDNPDSPAYLLLRVRILLDRGDWPQALKPLGLLLRRHPEEREAHLLAARIYFEQAGDLDRALELIREAERRFPNDPTFPELAGSMLLAENRSDEGLEQLRRALELEPGRVSSLRLVVAEAMRRHQWVLAGRTLQQVLAREQTDQDLRDAYAVATHVGDRERALGYADTLYRREASGEARLRYAEALLEAGKAEEARGLLAGADAGQFATPEAVSSLLFLQARLVEAENPDGALALLQRAVAENPDNEEAVRQLAAEYQRRGQLRQARLFYRAAVALDPEDAGLALRLEEVERALRDSGGKPPEAAP